MIYQTVSGDKWKAQVNKKLVSFTEKCPVLLSLVFEPVDGKDGVTVIHQNTDSQYFFPYDYNIQPMDFIHGIKTLLVSKHYPRLIEEITDSVQLTPEEMAERVEKGADMKDLPSSEIRVVTRKLWRIDKIFPWKDIVILVLEETDDKNDQNSVGISCRYKMNVPAALYLRKYRSNGFRGIKEASAYFFENSILIDKLGADKAKA